MCLPLLLYRPDLPHPYRSGPPPSDMQNSSVPVQLSASSIPTTQTDVALRAAAHHYSSPPGFVDGWDTYICSMNPMLEQVSKLLDVLRNASLQKDQLRASTMNGSCNRNKMLAHIIQTGALYDPRSEPGWI